MYDENYYKTLNYVDYLSREERYEKLADELCDLLKKIGCINPHSIILDYGCAVGFLVRGIIKAGYEDCHGYDISDWAKSQFITLPLECVKISTWNVITCLDVLEHMTDTEITEIFKYITRSNQSLVVRIPCSTDSGKSFHLDVSNRDKTHINCKTKEQWKDFLKQFGYKIVLPLNLTSIYDSKGVFCALLLK